MNILFLILFLLIRCASAKFDATSDVINGGQYSGASLEGGAVSEVQINSNMATLQFGDVTGSSNYILALYAYQQNGSTEAYQIGSSSMSSPIVSALTRAEPEDKTEIFHEWLRDEENNLNPDHFLGNDSKNLKKGPPPAALENGSERTFKVLSSFSSSSSYSNVTATLVYQTDHFYAYIDNRNLDSLDNNDLEELLVPFENVIENEQGLYGEESDVDGDGHFNILFTQQVNELGGSSGGIVTGFFYAVDLFDTSLYPQSNETEVYYTFVPDPTGAYGVAISKSFSLSNILPSVLPHEYQHMINFNMHYFINHGAPESAFLNEALSHLAEDIYSMNGQGYMTETGIENPARVAGYLASVDDLCIFCGASLYQRGGSYLLLRYLYEQAQQGNLPAASSGNDLLNRFLDTDLTGTSNIAMAAFGTDDIEGALHSLMGQFGLALFMSNTGLTTDSRLQFSGINLREAQNDNRGTVLRGPVINPISSFPMTNTVGGASISYVEITGNDIINHGGTLSLQLSEQSQAGAYLIQTGM